MSKLLESSQTLISMDFQHRLIELISDQECSNSDFAKLVGVSKDVISRAVLYGIIPSVRSLIKIADFLNISLEFLLAETDNPYFYKAEQPTTFHIRLEQLKDENNTKYSKIAHQMPFARNLFQEWLRRKTLPSLENLLSLSEYFNVSIDYLLGRTNDRHN